MKKEETDILQESRDFLASAKSLILATVDNDGAPFASYAPFVTGQDGVFYIFVSGLAHHAATLRNGRASVLIIEDEGNTRQIFARNRLTFDCSVEETEREHAPGPEILEKLRQRHGPVMDMLSALPDFVLYRLTPTRGVFVKGFGKAYEVDPTLTAMTRIDPRA